MKSCKSCNKWKRDHSAYGEKFRSHRYDKNGSKDVAYAYDGWCSAQRWHILTNEEDVCPKWTKWSAALPCRLAAGAGDDKVFVRETLAKIKGELQ